MRDSDVSRVAAASWYGGMIARLLLSQSIDLNFARIR